MDFRIQVKRVLIKCFLCSQQWAQNPVNASIVLALMYHIIITPYNNFVSLKPCLKQKYSYSTQSWPKSRALRTLL